MPPPEFNTPNKIDTPDFDWDRFVTCLGARLKSNLGMGWEDFWVEDEEGAAFDPSKPIKTCLVSCKLKFQDGVPKSLKKILGLLQPGTRKRVLGVWNLERSRVCGIPGRVSGHPQ